MKLNRDKYLLARANACVSIQDLVLLEIPYTEQNTRKFDRKQPERLPRLLVLM